MKRALLLATLVGANAIAFAEDVVWDNGVNWTVSFDADGTGAGAAANTNLGLTSGNLTSAGIPLRQYVQPFSIGAGGATISKITFDAFTPAAAGINTAWDQISVRVWTRTAFGAPVVANEVTLDADATPNILEVSCLSNSNVDDPRRSFYGGEDAYLYTLNGFTPFTLPAGDYWISIWPSRSIDDGDSLTLEQARIAWFCGAVGETYANSMPNLVRNTNYPTAAWTTTTLPGQLLSWSFANSANQRFNLAYTLYGTSALPARKVTFTLNWEDVVGQGGAPYSETNYNILDNYYRMGWFAPGYTPTNPLGVPITDALAGRYFGTMLQDYDANPNTYQTSFSETITMPFTTGNASLKTVFAPAAPFLQTVAEVSTTGGDTTVVYNLVNGDVDGDDEVGSTDFDTVVANFGNSYLFDVDPIDPADVDFDLEVGSSDFDIVVANFGETSATW
ncbi:MAG: hypothetical protein J0L72_01960 [Armatimonadetes bacterium]|nr:hypothetical protein [Armatimonadota bacterium]